MEDNSGGWVEPWNYGRTLIGLVQRQTQSVDPPSQCVFGELEGTLALGSSKKKSIFGGIRSYLLPIQYDPGGRGTGKNRRHSTKGFVPSRTTWLVISSYLLHLLLSLHSIPFHYYSLLQ